MYYFQDNLKAIVNGTNAPGHVQQPVPNPTEKKGPSPQEAPKEYQALKPVVTNANKEPLAKKELDAIEKKLVQPEAVAPAKGPEKKKEVDWKLVRAKIVDLLDDENWDDEAGDLCLFVLLGTHQALTMPRQREEDLKEH